MRTNHVFQVDVRTVRTFRTKADQIVLAQLLEAAQGSSRLGHVGKLALLSLLTEPSLKVRTHLRLFSIDAHKGALFHVRVSVNTFLFFWTLAVLLIEPTYRNFLRIVAVEVVTKIASLALVVHPVNAHELLPFEFINTVYQARVKR